MTTLTRNEIADFRASVRGGLERVWPSPRVAGEPDAGHEQLHAVWELAAAQEWTALGVDDALEAALRVMEELGRCACPLPLIDVYVASRLLVELEDAIVGGSLRPVVAVDSGDGLVRAVEAAGVATHVLLLPRVAADEARLCEVGPVEPTPGLAVPDWAEAVPSATVATAWVGADALEEARSLLRLGLVVRAAGAARRAHELALEHAKTRHAFGKPIGAFQAVSHRCANCEIDLVALRGLVDEAVRLRDADDSAWPLAAGLAVAYGADAVRRVQLGAHHTLAAIGFFDEHEAPWLFRRVQADVLRLAEFPPAAGEPADVFVEQGAGLPRLELGERAERFRAELSAFLDGRGPLASDPDLAAALAARGYLGMSWPREHGGRDASVEELMVLHEELRYRGAHPSLLAAAELIGNAIVRHGTREQQERFLPLIVAGKLPFYLGYSEPEVGSDLANLRTRAEREGDEWVITGQKLWGTGAHLAEYCWLAARTDPDAQPPHAGITVFLFSVPRPGWEIQRHRGLSGEISCTTFLDEVRVPDSARVGEVGGGWKVITDALAGERVVMGGVAAQLHRQLDELLDELRADPEIAGARGSAVRARVTGLAARVEAARILVNHGVRATAAGEGARLEAPMAKIVASEVHEDLCEAALEILGPRAALSPGVFEKGVRVAIKDVVGGGTNDIQRNLIARHLGLPR